MKNEKTIVDGLRIGSEFIMKRNGFTLIELLVTVAIIGILAVVGTVAYNGYTSSAKKVAVKAYHNKTIKYVLYEVQKCILGDEKVMSDNLACSEIETVDDAIAKAAVLALANVFLNPYKSWPVNAVFLNQPHDNLHCFDFNYGGTAISSDTTSFTISSCAGEDDPIVETISIE